MKRLLLVLLLVGAPLLHGADVPPVTLYIQLVCGTDAEVPPAPQAKLVGPKLDQRLRNVFRWKNYWEITHEAVTLRMGSKVRRRVTDQREIEVAWPSDRLVQVSLYTDGKLTRKRDQSIDAAFYIAGGDSTGSESWFIVLRRDNPEASQALAPKLATMP
jgi:hypothetical protein